MKLKRVLIVALLFVCITSLFYACKKNNVITLKIGATHNWYQGEDFTYYSSNDTIATIDEFGVVKAVSVGECNVYATTQTQSIHATIKVIKNVLPIYPSSKGSSSQTSQEQSQITSTSQDLNVSSLSGSDLSLSTQESANSKQNSTSTSSFTTITTSDNSSSNLEIYFTLDTKGGTIQDVSWKQSGDNYVTYSYTELPLPTKTGYNFVCWENDNGQVLSVEKGGTAYAEWQEISYEIEYVLQEGQNNENNPLSYKYFDEPITLLPALHTEKEFVGWYLDSEYTQLTTVIPNTKKKVVLYAKFANTFLAKFYFDNNEYSAFVEENTCLIKPNIQVETGYFIEWFTDNTYTNSYNFDLKVGGNIELYGKKYTELTSSFFGYPNQKITKANTMLEFQYYLEYTFFNNITSNNEIEVSQEVYKKLTTVSSTELNIILNKTTIPFLSLSRSNRISGGKYYYQVCSKTSVPDTFLTQTLSTISQYDYVQLGQENSFVSTREQGFDDFKYNELTSEIQVENSNQLFFVLEHRVKPIPVKGSNAEIALNKCKDILRRIINNDMTDLEKVLKIYRYLCYEVTYNLPQTGSNANSLQYDAFYVEGVLNNNQAVCDGICKTFSLLCNIEGIRCVRTASTSHAWNEVFINGNWYTIDVTHGNLSVNSEYEVLSHSNFLINESEKEALGYSDILRTEIVANGEYNYYKQDTFTYDNQTYDFVIESWQELKILLKWCNQQDRLYGYSSYTVDFVVDIDYVYNDFNNEISSAKNSAGLFGVSLKYVKGEYNGLENYIFVLS